jgi:hypothetical protein
MRFTQSHSQQPDELEAAFYGGLALGAVVGFAAGLGLAAGAWLVVRMLRSCSSRKTSLASTR